MESYESENAETMPPAQDTGGWWSRPAGGREVMAVALPLMISTFSYSLMQFCDRIFLTSSSSTSVAAVMPASVMSWTLLSFPFGVSLYTSVFVAQYFGAKQHRRIGQVLWHGLILGTLFIPVYVATMVWPEAVFSLFGHSPQLVEAEASYLKYISPGSVAQLYGAVLSGVFIGKGQTRIVMAVDLIAAAVNVWLDWLFIFGFSFGSWLVLAPLGITGAAIATSAALWIKCLIYAALICRKRDRVSIGLFDRFRFEGSLLFRMIRFGSSNGWQMLIECLGISVFSLMIGRLGEVPAAATTLAISVNMLVFVPVWGLSTAVSTLVGQNIGRGTVDLAARSTWTGLVIGLVYTTVFGVLYLSAPGWFMAGFDLSRDEADAVSNLVPTLLVFVALFCLFDTVQIVFVGAIKGAGDTLFVVGASIVCSAAFVAAGLGLSRLSDSPTDRLFAWWWALTGWIMLLAVVYLSRFLQGRWREMKVIEHVQAEESANSVQEREQPVSV